MNTSSRIAENLIDTSQNQSLMPAHKINSAIRDCLDQCYASENPLGGVAGFLNRLSEHPGWSEDEIEQVEAAVRRILKAVVMETPSDKDD